MFSRAASETAVIPPNVPMATALTRDFMRLLKGIAPCRLRFKRENIVNKRIIPTYYYTLVLLLLLG